MDIFPDVKKAIDQFPGPITFLFYPPPKWMTPAALFMTVVCLFVIFRAPYSVRHWHTIRVIMGIGTGIFGTIFFGANAVLGLLAIFKPAASFLRLDESGFVVRNFLQTRVFSWDQVSSFKTDSTRGSRLVFTAGGQAGILSDRYGFSGRDLLQLMTLWQKRSLDRKGSTFAPSPPSGESLAR